MVSGANEAIDWRLWFLVFSWQFGALEYYFKFEKKSRVLERTKSQSAVGSRARQPVGKDGAVVERPAEDTTGRERCEEVSVCRESPTTQARRLRDQSKSRKRG